MDSGVNSISSAKWLDLWGGVFPGIDGGNGRRFSYWADQATRLREQIEAMEEPPLEVWG